MKNSISSISFTTLFMLAALTPSEVRADILTQSDVRLAAFAEFSSQRVPQITDSASNSAPPSQVFTNAQALVKSGLPFPNVPNSQNSGFASSTTTVGGVFGVGVNGFFLQNSLPPNFYGASGEWSTSITNNTTSNEIVALDFTIPNPTFQFFGNIGDFFPPGANPALDAQAVVNITLRSTLTRADGSVVDTVHLDYGMRTERDPQTGVLGVVPTPDGGSASRFDEPDGSFGFQLGLKFLVDFILGDLAPGDRLDFRYDYFAQASTGFGETAVFAAIGDPFNLTLGSPINLKLLDAEPQPPTPTVPEPATLTMLGLGLVAVRAVAGRRRTHQGREPTR
jgi:hypothetical protein